MAPWFAGQRLRGRKAESGLFRRFLASRMVRVALRRKILREKPDIIHIFGRLAEDLWGVLPPNRTVLHHGTEGKVDPSWTFFSLLCGAI
jgi:hypothetical protein